ncbi:hypothetical protein [Sulfurovum sp.]|uniref:hypothetical protein n=1 Tax=Sulfurovum sp. TaxID=1969726 RepID=UPI0025EF0C7E|nr:hypothetical protein [Sulfurovum sp.]
MKKTILLLSLGLTTILSANAFDTKHMEAQHPQAKKHLQKKMEYKHLKAVHQQHMKKMDKKFAHKKALKRSFRTHEEFKRMKGHHAKKIDQRHHRKLANRLHENRHDRNVNLLNRSSRYTDRYRGYYDDDYGRDDYRKYNRYPTHRARGYRHTRNSWYLAYRYERASFYDRHGYYYGYFNHRGYMFEGEFYRYDRYYTYRDRVRGKGLFEHRFYRPVMEYYYAGNDYYGHFGGFEFFFRR